MSASKPQMAVQMYSIHKYSEKVGFAKSVEDVAKIGYKGIEFAGYWNFKAEELKKLLDDNGLAAVGTHVGRDQFESDKLKAACEFCLGYGNNLLICPGGGNMPPGVGWGDSAAMANKDDWWKFLVDFYAKAADEAAKFGCKIGLHNHAWEFEAKLSDGSTMWDYFFSNTPDNVVMEQDVGWTTFAGQDPCEQYRKYPHRSVTLHAKENGMDTEDFDAILGKPGAGVKGVDWDKLYPVAAADGIKWYVVECERHFDSLDAITPSYKFISKYL